jgi:adenylyl-sulfate kinase
MSKGFTLWFTGLSGAGNTTLAKMVEEQLLARDCKVELLDNDTILTHLSKGLDYSHEDQDTNILRIGFVAKLLTRNWVVALVSTISPYRATRDQVRTDIGNFIEVYVKCPLEVCMQRDVKGFYKRALAGEITQFTGISDTYEEPLNPEIVVETANEAPFESALKIMARLEELGYLATEEDIQSNAAYTQEEEEEVSARLEALGYL